MAQYQRTDQSIFALGADGKGGVILSKVPKHGADEIRIARLGKDGKLVLKDKTGAVLEAAFGDGTYRWDGKTPLTNMLQKYSFANRGFVSGATDSGSKTTHRNIAVTGAEWQPVPTGPSPTKAPAAQVGALQKQLAALQKQLSPAAAKKTTPAKEKKPTPAKAKKPTPAKAKKPTPTNVKGKGNSKAKKQSPVSIRMEAADRDDLETKLREMLDTLESGRKKKRALPAAAGPSKKKAKKEDDSDSSEEEEDSESSEEEEDSESSEEEEEDSESSDDEENMTHKFFVAGKAMLAAHYMQVAGEMPDFKMNAKDLRHELLATRYDEAKLRELADGADIEHARITKIDTLRSRLMGHFAELLPSE
jgi:hypothetical protein